MSPTEIRRMLLSQHEELRRLIDDAVQAALEAPGARAGERLREHVAAVGALLRAHNEAEEAALAPYLRGLDSWGPHRVAQMIEHHTAEHDALLGALEGALADGLSPRDRAGALGGVLRDLREHMAREEREFLAPEVLNDEFIYVSGGTDA